VIDSVAKLRKYTEDEEDFQRTIAFYQDILEARKRQKTVFHCDVARIHKVLDEYDEEHKGGRACRREVN